MRGSDDIRRREKITSTGMSSWSEDIFWSWLVENFSVYSNLNALSFKIDYFCRVNYSKNDLRYSHCHALEHFAFWGS